MPLPLPRLLTASLLAGLCLPAMPAAAAPTGNPASTDPAATDADFPFQGEYAGVVTHEAGETTFGVQVVALGDGTFSAVAYPGGLPGDGWQAPDKITGSGVREGDVVRIEGVDLAGTKRRGEIRRGELMVLDDAGNSIATLPKVERKSPTLGKAAPENAIVLFDGPGPVDETKTLVNPRITDDGLLMEGVNSRDAFGDGLWHVEFRLPYQPKDRGQGRGNSGCYVAGAYEVQMLDSFGLEGKNNECGGVYSVAAPSVNMCLPPLAWQTYDIQFTAPKFKDGTKVADARMTVWHNGVVVHDDVAVPKITPAGPQKQEGPSGPLHLQNHGNPVRYRNIWFQPQP